MGKAIVFILAVIFSFNSYADTIIDSPEAKVSGIWKKENSPYIIKTFRDIGTLIIEAGVTIECNEFRTTTCDTLIACGTSSEPIIFKSDSSGLGEFYIISKFLHLQNIQFQYNAASVVIDNSKSAKFEKINFNGVNFVRIYRSNAVFESVSFITSGCDFETSSGPLLFDGCKFENVSFNFIHTPVEIANSTIMFNRSDVNSKLAFIGDSTSAMLKNTSISGFSKLTPSADGLKVLRLKTFIMSGCTVKNNDFNIEIQDGDTAIIQNNEIYNNSKSLQFQSFKYLNVDGNRIHHNNSPAIVFVNGIRKAEIRNNLFTNNIVTRDGSVLGTMDNLGFTVDTMTITGNIIANNYAETGGVFCVVPKILRFQNNTIVNNYSKKGPGVVLYTSCSVNNSIFIGNKSGANNKQLIFYWDKAKSSRMENCVIENGIDGVGSHFEGDDGIFTIHPYDGISNKILNENPLFISPSPGTDTIYDGTKYDWRVSQLSPCIDNGTNAGIEKSDSIDFWGNNRIINTIIDIGAYEFTGVVKALIKKTPYDKIPLYKSQKFDLLGRNLYIPQRGVNMTIVNQPDKKIKQIKFH